jgi:hypothetical protein
LSFQLKIIELLQFRTLRTVRHLFFISILLVLVISCKKEESKHWTEVKITVQNDITGEPIGDAFCGVYTQTGGVINGGVEELHTSNTANGVYEFGFKAKKNKTYWAEAIYDNDKYYNINFSTFMNLNNGAENEFLMTLVPRGQLSTKITNVSCFDTNDEIIVYRPNLDVPSYNGYSPTPKFGCYTGTSSYVSLPTGRYSFEWHVTKNNITDVFYDTLNLMAGDSVLYEINY